MDKFHCIIRYLREVESLWSKQEGRLTLLGIKVKNGRICISEDDAYRIYGIRNFGDFWRTSSPINTYRVYKDNGKIYVEFEGNRGQLMSYLYVGAFACHMRRIRVATEELEKIENELTTEVLEWGKRNSQREEARSTIATKEQVREVEEEWDEEEWDGEEEDEEEDAQEEEEEEPPRKMMKIRKVFWGVCRTSDYDPETMEPYPRCND
jgi:hypothetical protein